MESKVVKRQQSSLDPNQKVSADSSPQIWGNLLHWCNSEVTSKARSGRSNTRPHECKTCGKRFTLLENLNRHQMIHTNQRPFHCPHCSKSFRLSQHLKEHIRIHTGEKPYKCHICGHAFCQISNLKSHQKTHTKVKGFRCDMCGKEFRRSFTLKQHKLTHSKSSRSKAEAQDRRPDLMINEKNVHTMVFQSTENSEKIGDSRKADYLLNAANAVPKTLLKNANEVKDFPESQQKKTMASSHFMTFWNTFCQNSKNETTEKHKRKGQEQNSTTKLNSCDLLNDKNKINAYSQISKFFGLAHAPSLNGTPPKEEKFNSSQNAPFLQFNAIPSSIAPLHGAPFGLSTTATSLRESETQPKFTHSPIPSPRSEKNLSIEKEQAEKVALDNSSRKRKQTSSLRDPGVNSSTIFNDELAKNNLIPKTRQAKSLTPSQEYNWKRQLCREWLHEEVGQRRSNSAETSRDTRALSAKCRVVSLSVDGAKSYSSDFSRSEDMLPKFTRSFSSFDDDVFSPVPTSSIPSAPTSDLKINSNSSPSVVASVKNTLQETKAVFHFPDVTMQQKLRLLSEKKRDTKDLSPFLFNTSVAERNELLPKNNQKSLDGYCDKSNSMIPHLYSNKFANPLLKQSFYEQNNSSGKSLNAKTFGSKLDSQFLNEIKNENLNFPKPWLDLPPKYGDFPVSPQMQTSPDFKSLSSPLSFVPLVSWRPVVTGWRNIVDGNVYPARLGVGNLNPFSLQQQIS